MLKVAAATITSLVGAPSIIGGPVCCLFDSPYLGLRTSAGAVGITANSETAVFANGDNSIFEFLKVPISTGLTSDSSVNSYSHCGKWLNSAYVDATNSSIVHGFFHQEWHCDYANNEYTNKSIGYARSEDGGLTFSPYPTPSDSNPGVDQIIAGFNTTTRHQTGEGDHGVVRVGNFLYLLFINWDASHDGISVGLARSPISSGGTPGSWVKFYNGTFNSAEPGVGGRADAVSGSPGTAVSRVIGGTIDALVVVGVILSSSMGISWIDVNNSDSFAPSTFTPAAAGPLFNADWSNWDRSINASELFGYPSLVSDSGSPDASIDPYQSTSLVFTYLAPRSSFTDRWLVRRPVTFFMLPPNAPSNSPPPPALVTLSLWKSADGTRTWPTTSPVSFSTIGNFSKYSDIALLLTSNVAKGTEDATEIIECALGDGSTGAPVGGTVVLTTLTECGQGLFADGAKLRVPGWISSSKQSSDALGWGKVMIAGSNGDSFAGAISGELWRCQGNGNFNYTVTFNDRQCVTAGGGWTPDRSLGWALSLIKNL
jgi:hypothetical protein